MKACALICTRNGRSRIIPALDALYAQRHVPAGCLEILVADNGSDDGSQAVIDAHLAGSPFPAVRIDAPGRGKMTPFLAGVRRTAADLIVMVDDDNLLGPDFICGALELFAQSPKTGMAGSSNKAVFPENHAKPEWFDKLASFYACADPIMMSDGLGIVAGAGSAFRRQPLLEALNEGYVFFNDTTRRGSFWITGEDTELCFLLHAAGWQTGADPRLQLRHVMTPERLSWTYARKMARTIGTSAAGIDPFIVFRSGVDQGVRASLRTSWTWHCLAKLRRLSRHGLALPKLAFGAHIGDHEVIEMEHDLGSLLRVLHERGRYTVHLRRTRDYLRRLAASQTLR